MIDVFIQRWEVSAASERANDQLFLTDLRAVLELEPPRPAGANDGAKTLARHVTGVRAPAVQRLVDALAALGLAG